MKIIANVDFSTQLMAGGSYELPDSDARLLIAAGLASAADEPAATGGSRGRSYTRRDRQSSQTRDLQAANA